MLVEWHIVSDPYQPGVASGPQAGGIKEPAGNGRFCYKWPVRVVVMSKFTAEELEQELKRRKAARDATPDKQQCVNCGKSFSSLTAEASEHGLCDDCLLGDLDE